MDVISMISKDQSLPDGEVIGLYGSGSPYYINGPRVHEYLQEMHREVLSKYDIMTVGEACGVSVEEAQLYAGEDRNELNMIFQFDHVEGSDGEYGKWTTDKYDFMLFKEMMNLWQEKLPDDTWNSLYLSNHDQPRCVSRFGNDSEEYREISAKMLATCLHMMKGTPYVYQGEELGMTNAYFEDITQYRDIQSRQCYVEFIEKGIYTPEVMMECLKLRSRDNARTPMQWNTEKNAGFSEGEPWIEVNPNYKWINAEEQMNREDSVRSYYKKLIQLRKEHEIIVYGDYRGIERDNEQIFAYERELGAEKLLVVCNFTDNEPEFTVPEDFDLDSAVCLIANTNRNEYVRKMQLKPYEAFVLSQK